MKATHAGITVYSEKFAGDNEKDIRSPFEDLNGNEEDEWDEALIPVDAQIIDRMAIK